MRHEPDSNVGEVGNVKTAHQPRYCTIGLTVGEPARSCVSTQNVLPLPPNFQIHTRIMYAIVEIAGQQFKIQKGRSIYTHRLEGDVDAALASDKVKILLVDNEGSISIGAPTVAGAMVSAKIMEHLKGEKVIIFKKKRRKGYKKKNGHRQYLTKVMIEDITV